LGHTGRETCLASIGQSDFLEHSNKFHHTEKTGFVEEFHASFITGVEIQSFYSSQGYPFDMAYLFLRKYENFFNTVAAPVTILYLCGRGRYNWKFCFQYSFCVF
jgi:hypothetical protein